MDANLRLPQPLSDSVLELFVRPAWHENAACSGLGNEMFFAQGSSLGSSRGSRSVTQARAARAVCAVCPVLEQCHEAGLGEKYGIWGGTTERDRRILRRRRRLTCL